ncbi:MAG TPA: dihydrofolate reductase family protein [Puia sp.]|nr:dihydrofolate reductase family protein [Puia sp.]
MRDLILVVHTSLDGFVSGINGELDGFEASQENLEFVCRLTEEADTALFGRISYTLLNDYWPVAKDRPQATKGEIAYSTWYNGAKKIVISRTLAGEHPDNTEIISGNLSREITRIKDQPGKSIMIFGSPSVSRMLMEDNLIDSYWIFINPTIFGEGIPLFTTLPDKIKLRLVGTKPFANGEFALHYLTQRSDR